MNMHFKEGYFVFILPLFYQEYGGPKGTQVNKYIIVKNMNVERKKSGGVKQLKKLYNELRALWLINLN